MTAVRTNHEHKSTSIRTFFAHRNVFVTGGTGFLGAVLIESILSTSPDVGNIYVLVRDKYGSNANTRIQRLIAKPIFKAHSEDALKKIVPVIGELSEKNFGIKDDEYERLKQSVNILYHCAATIKFNTHLKSAIIINLIGTYRTIEFAKSLKNLVSYVYLSTAFCNSNQENFIEDKVYASEQDPYEMMKLVQDDELWARDSEEELNAFIGNHPNTYTFTKQLAENLILKELAGLPAGIVRPSVVYGTYKDPLPGWVGNANSGHLGLLVGFVKGLFRTICGNPDALIDIIPCDYVINAAITMGWYVGTRKLDSIEVIHSTSGERNPLNISKFCEVLNESAPKNPCDSIVWMPQAKIRNGLRYEMFVYLFHLIPAMILLIPETILHRPSRKTYVWRDFVTSQRLLTTPVFCFSAFTYMQLFHKGSKVFNYFINKNFQYSFKNALRIMGEMHPDDVDRYQFDAKNCDFTKLMEGCLLGIRRYYFHESYNTTMWHRAMYQLFKLLHYIGWIFILAIIYFLVLPLAVNLKLTFAIASSIWLFLIWL
ncbi:putative fatty acyl-CoA reductase [Pseudolycoriella hygida]|uniref:Fatty acyl-CoA reductase n=1 Tax=Pseudolycoriella hygida TaxID=35572 RepID=A0A9Q0NH35_9DIPT|nr:putative fatty acyl-CoA reductase [Pseudolycoriella hygida]